MNSFIKHRLTVMAVVFGLLVSTFGFVNQPQPASASISKPRVTVRCEGSLLYKNYVCSVILDREATAGLAYLRKVGRMTSDQIIENICRAYGKEFQKSIKERLTLSWWFINFEYPWYPDCIGTLTALSWWHNPDFGQVLDVNSAFGGCLYAKVNVSGFLHDIVADYDWWPPPFWWIARGYQWGALNDNARFDALPIGHINCFRF